MGSKRRGGGDTAGGRGEGRGLTLIIIGKSEAAGEWQGVTGVAGITTTGRREERYE